MNTCTLVPHPVPKAAFPDPPMRARDHETVYRISLSAARGFPTLVWPRGEAGGAFQGSASVTADGVGVVLVGNYRYYSI